MSATICGTCGEGFPTPDHQCSVNCQLCGTPVRVVGHTTKHYEPVLDYEQGTLTKLRQSLLDERKKTAALQAELDYATIRRKRTHRFVRQYKNERDKAKAEVARLREALARTIPHAECMQQRYKADEDRVQAAVDIRFARDQLSPVLTESEEKL